VLSRLNRSMQWGEGKGLGQMLKGENKQEIQGTRVGGMYQRKIRLFDPSFGTIRKSTMFVFGRVE